MCSEKCGPCLRAGAIRRRAYDVRPPCRLTPRRERPAWRAWV
ncbi:hypothetical protein WQQ_29130 [Hydrocarboniphaga effusa AP103]|uniref:Uncharacterized protein n=1 Tax=Hydrocarboniphaga effusa AP103 TaxID=1172194 RepID=I8I049_9GAMM|nr:hypothetical protein WQQ_29130 [Hydrocarboniphaga effusa AP103]